MPVWLENLDVKGMTHLDHFSVLESYTICGAWGYRLIPIFRL